MGISTELRAQDFELLTQGRRRRRAFSVSRTSCGPEGRLSRHPCRPKRARQLGAHWEFVNDQLHHHHLVEDASLWPLVRPKLSGRDSDLAVLDETEARHVTPLPTCEAIGEGLASLAQAPGECAGGALADDLDALGTLLASQLEHEELRCFPVIDQALTFDSADPVERNAVLDMPPPPVRVPCRYVWDPRYERPVAPLWAG